MILLLFRRVSFFSHNDYLSLNIFVLLRIRIRLVLVELNCALMDRKKSRKIYVYEFRHCFLTNQSGLKRKNHLQYSLLRITQIMSSSML